MSLAHILGIFLLLSWPWPAQSTQPQESQSSTSSPAAPSDQGSPQSPATNPPSSDKSQPCTSGKPNCQPPASTGDKTKKKQKHKTIVRDGGTDETTVDLSPGPSPQQATRQTESTRQLLAATDANLRKIAGRQLSPSQQDTVKQIKSYMGQASKAETEGDAQRAHNLAVKASLLSADLAGPEKK